MRLSLLRDHPARSAALLVASGLVISLLILEMSSSAPAQTGDPSPLAPVSTLNTCASGVQPPSFASHDLGASFAGLPLTGTVQDCSPSAPPAWSGNKYVDSPATIANTTLTYGTCEIPADSLEGGCSPPLEIQLWPQCARKLALYTQTDSDGQQQPYPHTMLSLAQVITDLLPGLPDKPSAVDLGGAVRQLLQSVGQLSPRVEQAIPDAAATLTTELARIPAASFDDGSQIELYTGDTTIVVFANDPAMAKSAAAAIGLKLALQPGGVPSGDLMAQATSTTGCA